jgi:fatty acid desaturase
MAPMSTEAGLRTGQSTPMYAEVAGLVRAAGLMRRRPWPYALLVSANTLGLLAVVVALFAWRDSWWLVAWGALLAVVFTQIGFVGHDIAHRQVTRNTTSCTALGLLHANLLTGLSYGWWMDKHNAHHAHPNDLGADPDVRAGVLVFDVGQVEGRTGWHAMVTRHQAWMFFPLLLLEGGNLYLAGLRTLAHKGIRHRATELLLIGVHTAAYVSLLVATMTWAQVVVFIAVHQGLRGLYLGLSFAPNHKGMPVLSGSERADPFLRQVLTSRNVRGGVVVDWVLGGLNYQIEHHLFPSMPRANLRRAQAIVRPYCAAHGVAYVETSATASYRAVIEHLHAVGAPLRTARPAPS